MAGSLNRAMLIGHLGADPEMRRLTSGQPVASFNIATSESWKDNTSGEKKERTEWHRIVVFGGRDSDGLAGVVEKYLKKGSKVYVSGQMRTRSWEDQQGVKRYTTEVVLSAFGSELLLLDRAEGNRPPPNTGDDSSEADRYRAAKDPESAKKPLGEEMDDEIPF